MLPPSEHLTCADALHPGGYQREAPHLPLCPLQLCLALRVSLTQAAAGAPAAFNHVDMLADLYRALGQVD